MANAGIGRQNRLRLILVKVGTPVAKAVFEKHVKDLTPTDHNPSPWTVDEFLLANKPKLISLKLCSQNWSKIFPSSKLQKWDLALLCNILIECCDLPSDIKLDIIQLRKLRNKLSHTIEPSTDDHKYQLCLMKFEVIFDRCLNKINRAVFTTEINQTFENLKQQQVSQADAEEVLKMLKSMHDETNERFDKVAQNQRLTDKNIRDLTQEVQALRASFESAEKLKVPEARAKIEVRNCSTETDDEISTIMVQCVKECIDDDGEVSESASNFFHKIKEGVYKMYSKLLGKDCAIVSAQNKCVFLTIRCSSLASLLSLFDDYVSGQLALEIQEVEEAIRKLDGCEDIALEIIMNTDELLETIKEIVTAVSELMKVEGILIRTSEKEIQSKGKYERNDLHTLKDIPEDVKRIRALVYEMRQCYPEQGAHDDTEDVITALSSTVTVDCLRKKIISNGIIVAIIALCCMVFMMNIRQRVHQDTIKSQENSTVLYMTDAMEMYRTQRQVANDMEQLYLKCSEHPEMAKEVQRTVLSVVTQHSKVLHLMDWLNTQTIMDNLIDPGAKTINEIKEMFTKIMDIARNMETFTRTTQLGCRDIQTRTHKQLVSTNKKFAKMKRMKEMELDEIHKKEQKLLVFISRENIWEEVADSERFEHKVGGTGVGTLFAKILGMAIGGFPLHGGVAGTMVSLLERPKTQQEFSKTEDEIRQINKRKEDLKQQLSQTKIDLENMDSLKEIHAKLRNVDKHLTGVIKFWSDIVTVIEALRDESTKSAFISEIVNPKLAKKFQSPIDRALQSFKSMQESSSAYVQESDKEIYTMYKFLLDPINGSKKGQERC